MSKRILYLFLAIVMVFSLALLNGCKAKVEETPEATDAGVVSEEPTATTVPEPVNLKIMTQSNPETIDCATMPMWQNVQAEANVIIEWDQVRSGWEEKKALVLASGDLPDIFLGGLTSGDIITNLDAFVELTDLVDQYAPNVAKMFDENSAALYLSTIPGEGIYSLPMVLGFRPQSCATLMINKQWLDTLGLAVPTTLDELGQVLVAFRDGDPNGNGEADEIPLDWPSQSASGISPHSIHVLTGAYGVVDDNIGNNLVVKDGVVSFLWKEEAYYKLEQLLHEWYAQDLINPEVFTNDYAASTALSTQGEVPRVGVTTGWSPANRTGQFAAQYVVIPQLKESADSTVKTLWPCNPDILSLASNHCELTTMCENVEAAMGLINLLYTDDFSIQSYYGSIPDYVKKNDDGTYELLAPADGSPIERSKWINSLVDYGVGNFSEDLVSRTVAPAEITLRLEEDDVYADSRPADVYPMVKFDAATEEELVFLKTDIMKLVFQKEAEWVVNGGIEDEWQGYLDSLNQMGLERLVEIYQNAYDEYNK